jgi:hypothetical protein
MYHRLSKEEYLLMPILEFRIQRSYSPPISVTLGDLDSELIGLGLDSARRTVPSPQFQSFSLQCAFLHYNNLQDPLFRVFLRNLFGLTRSDDVSAEDPPDGSCNQHDPGIDLGGEDVSGAAGSGVIQTST